MRSKSWRFVVFAVASALLFEIVLPSVAQIRRRGAPMYNPATEITVKGTVEAVDQIQGPPGWGGTHLRLKTENETLDVHVGPSWFLSQNKMTFVKGDKVDVTGSRVRFAEQHALIARQVKKGNESIILRDKLGFPAWSRHRQPIS